jgi:predicted esterase
MLCLGAAEPEPGTASGHLVAQPQDRPAAAPLPAGKPVRLAGNTLAYIPRSAPPTEPRRLLVVLGGTGADHSRLLRRFTDFAEAANVVIVAPASQRENFDAIESFFDDYEARRPNATARWPRPRFGADSAAIDAALAQVFSATLIDRRSIGILGFSHGGSYALSLGTANPQLFSTVAALSPGVLIFEAEQPGRQRIYLAHGRSDPVQPFDRTAKSFAPKLESLGYEVTFEPYDGSHTTPSSIMRSALLHFLGASPPAR